MTELTRFENKDVLLFTLQGFRYKGRVIGVSDGFLFLNDIKVGRLALNLSEIREIQEVRE